MLAWRNTALVNRTHRIGFRMFDIFKYATQLSCNFEHSHCTFVTILFRPFARLLINLAMRIRALYQKSASIFWLVEQVLWRMPLFTEWSGASSFEVILARQSRHSSTRVTSGSRCIFHTLLRRRSRRRIRLCRFCTLHCQQSPRLLLFTLFCPLVLDQGVSFIISASGAKIVHS